jgi:sugar-specific transcriptional regulator TrmB
VYVHVVAHTPMTANRIAREINKPTSNVYKAVEALTRRGALLVEEGEHRVCRAVPVAECFRRMEEVFLRRTRAAEDRLSRPQPHAFNERVYRIEEVEDVPATYRQLLERAARPSP